MQIDEYYDVFISFKNRDKNGQETKDKLLARKLYDYLTSKNLTVFFSDITLQELGVDEWEREINKSLQCSKVFIAIGSKKEYLESEWLQRERTIFLTLRDLDNSKAFYGYILSPMTLKRLPYDMQKFEIFQDDKPDELKRLYGFVFKHLKNIKKPIKKDLHLNKIG